MDRYAFVSLVGHQIFGVLNAIMCAAGAENSGCPLSKIVLYPTADLVNPKTANVSRGTLEEAQVIEKFCREHQYPSVEIKTIDRTENRFAELIGELSGTGEGILFNLKGGMNYAVSQYISELIKSGLQKAAVIISDGPVCHTVKLSDDVLTATPRWEQSLAIPRLQPAEILAVQNTPYTLQEGTSELISYLRFTLRNPEWIPEDALSGVTIANVTSDLVWNAGGNHLSLLISAHGWGKASMSKESMLSRIRNIAQWSASKSELKNFYDAKIHVLCEFKAHVENLDRESRGKARPIKSFSDTARTGGCITLMDMCAAACPKNSELNLSKSSQKACRPKR